MIAPEWDTLEGGMDKLNVAYLQAMIRIVATASALLALSAEAD